MYAIIDVETAGNFEVPKIYDIAVTICDKQGNDVDQQNWIIEEVFKNKKLMKSAYYSKKLPLYYEMLASNPRMLVPFSQMKQELNFMLEVNDANYITAYNLRFDMGALKYTNYKYDYPKHGWEECKFFYDKYQYIDLWALACQTIGQQKKFKNFVDSNGLISDKGNRKSSAEVMYAFLLQDPTFAESHTALADCEIEKEIMLKCFSMKKKYSRNTYVANPWKLIQD